MLARIITELKLLKTRVGTTALCAAVGDDITAWVLLALVVTIVNASNSLVALYVFLLTIAWGLILIFLVRPLLLKLIIKTGSNVNGPTVPMMVFTLLLVLTSAFVTNIIGVHAVFGALMAGVTIPHFDGFALGITEKIEVFCSYQLYVCCQRHMIIKHLNSLLLVFCTFGSRDVNWFTK